MQIVHMSNLRLQFSVKKSYYTEHGNQVVHSFNTQPTVHAKKLIRVEWKIPIVNIFFSLHILD